MQMIQVNGYAGEITLATNKIMSLRERIPVGEENGPLTEVMMATGDASEEWLVRESLPSLVEKLERA